MKPTSIMLLLIFLPATLFAQTCPTQGNWLQVLGSGGPETRDKRASSSYLLWIDGKARVLIDAGGGAALRFGQSDASVSTLDAVLFSHFHIDHSADFPALVKSSFFESRTEALPVFGPKGNELLPSTTDYLHRLFSEKGVWPYLGHFLPGQRHFSYELQPHDIDFNSDNVIDVFSNERIHLRAIRVHHGPLPALAWRIDITGSGSVTFSGDMSGEFGLLPKLAAGSNILVAHNAIAEDTRGIPRFLHMPPSVIANLAHTSQADTLVLSHFMMRSLTVKAQTRDIIVKKFNGQIVFSNDLDCIAVGEQPN